MTEHIALPRSGPSLRLASFTVENFRAITERVELVLGDEPGKVDPIAVFHGRNGAGKSTALLALALGFELLRRGFGRNEDSHKLRNAFGAAETAARLGRRGITARDQPQDTAHPLRIGLEFQEPVLGRLTIEIAVVGVELFMTVRDIHRRPLVDPNAYQAWFSQPYGPTSRPFDALDSRRYASWVTPSATGSLIQPDLAERLFHLRISREPRQRESWRYFTEVLQRFEPFQGKLISIDRIQKDAAPELTFEDRGELILGLDDLSNGEQQIVALIAGVLLSDAAILAIEEPELNLDAENQALLRDILAETVTRGFKDQIFLESHVATFDGPGVIRFDRPDGVVRAQRAVGDARRSDEARKSGAHHRWVSRDGYTRLPPDMVDDLRLARGGPLWFLKGERAWEAWREDDLAKHLGDDEEPVDG
jgi:hypothetical protein